MDDLWKIDRAVLVEIVRQIEVDGLARADIAAAYEKAGITPEVGQRSLTRLVNARMVWSQPQWSGLAIITGITERGLRGPGRGRPLISSPHDSSPRSMRRPRTSQSRRSVPSCAASRPDSAEPAATCSSRSWPPS